MVFKMWEGISCSSFSVKELGVIVHKKVFSLCNMLPEASMAIGYCRCLRLSVRPCVNHLLVRVITRDLFKLGSPNLNHRCKRPWLRSLLFWGVIDLYLQGQIYLWSQNLPHFEPVCVITHHPFKLGPPNLDHRTIEILWHMLKFQAPALSWIKNMQWNSIIAPLIFSKIPTIDIL